ncbi:MAG: hypothetical protein K2G92_02315, partial [Duncaniella sp.]|nr:hypothetical protein [Duncaniella sp.]
TTVKSVKLRQQCAPESPQPWELNMSKEEITPQTHLSSDESTTLFTLFSTKIILFFPNSWHFVEKVVNCAKIIKTTITTPITFLHLI